MIEWANFYDAYSEWSDSKLKSRIALLETIDSGSELACVIPDINNTDIKALPVRKAIQFRVSFVLNDFEIPDGEICS